MPYTTVVAGTTITAAWSNANNRDQVVTPFATAAARTSAITAPVTGMLSYRSDASVFEGYYGAAWAPLPGTVLGRGDRITSSSTTTTEVGVLRIDSISIISGRIYKIFTSPLSVTSSVSTDVIRATVRYSTSGAATTASTTVDLMQASMLGGGNAPLVPFTAIFAPGVTGTLSILLTVSRTAGTGNVSISAASTNPIDMWIEDAGVDPGDTGVDI